MMQSPLISAAEGLDKHAEMVEGWADDAYESAVRSAGHSYAPALGKEERHRFDAQVLRKAAEWLRAKAGTEASSSTFGKSLAHTDPNLYVWGPNGIRRADGRRG